MNGAPLGYAPALIRNIRLGKEKQVLRRRRKKFDGVINRTVDDDNEETVYTVTDEAPILYKRLSVVNAVPPNKLECLSLHPKYIYIKEAAYS